MQSSRTTTRAGASRPPGAPRPALPAGNPQLRNDGGHGRRSGRDADAVGADAGAMGGESPPQRRRRSRCFRSTVAPSAAICCAVHRWGAERCKVPSGEGRVQGFHPPAHRTQQPGISHPRVLRWPPTAWRLTRATCPGRTTTGQDRRTHRGVDPSLLRPHRWSIPVGGAGTNPMDPKPQRLGQQSRDALSAPDSGPADLTFASLSPLRGWRSTGPSSLRGSAQARQPAFWRSRIGRRSAEGARPTFTGS